MGSITKIDGTKRRRRPTSLFDGYLEVAGFSKAAKDIQDINSPEVENTAIAEPPPEEGSTQSNSDNSENHTSGNTSDQTSNDPSNLPTTPPTTHPTTHPTVPPATHPTQHPTTHPTIHPTKHPTQIHGWSKPYDNPLIGMTEKQRQVLLFLIQQESKITSKAIIMSALQISEGTLKTVMKALKDKRFLLKTEKYTNGRFQGFRYRLDESFCTQFVSEYGMGQQHPTTHPAIHPTTHPSHNPSYGTSDHASCHYSSSSSSYKETATKPPPPNVQGVLNSDPELGYWREKGLTAKQVEAWMGEFDLGLESMIQSLCHCRFAMVDLGMEENKPVENVFNWFYSILKRSGYYGPPKGYKSFRQIQIEREHLLLEEKEKQIEQLRAIRKRREEQEFALTFEEMMSQPEGDLFQQCFELLTKEQKKGAQSLGKKGRIFEEMMREMLAKHLEERDRKILETSEDENLQ